MNYIGNDIFNYTINDNDGATSNVASVYITVDGPLYITNLSANWNLISLSVNQSININDVIVNYDGTDFTWSDAINSSDGPIIDPNVYSWNRSLDMYFQIQDSFNPGYGYWIYSYYDCELWVENITSISDDYITELEEKWNIVGIPTYQNVDISNLIVHHDSIDYSWMEAIDPVNGPIVDPNVYGYPKYNNVPIGEGTAIK